MNAPAVAPPLASPPPASPLPLAGWSVLDPNRAGYPAEVNVQAMVAALARLGAQRKDAGGGLGQLASRAAIKLGQQRHIATLSRHKYIGITMGLPARFIYPQALYARLALYAFDCWEPQFDAWERFFRRNAFRLVIFSARDAAEEMGRRLPGQAVAWLCEGIDPTPFDPTRPLAERQYDLVQFGRSSPEVNDLVAAHCAARGYAHHYRKGDAWLFPTQDDFVRGLADSKLVIALPQSITHPHHAGRVETMSLRYLEIIASGALLLGRCPPEMADWFGYDPVIALDYADPCGQLDHLLANIADYEPLRQRNLARMRETATSDARARAIAALL